MNDVPEYYKNLMGKCLECGQCLNVCPSNTHGGCSPLDVMIGEDGNVIKCIGCGLCSSVCPVTDPFSVMMFMKCRAKGSTVPDSYDETGFILNNSFNGDCPAPEYDGDDVYVMPGCQVKCKYPFLEYAACEALKAVGTACSEVPGDSCCTFPIVFRNLSEDERMDIITEKMGRPSKGKDIITMCLGCFGELEKAGITTEHIVDYLSSHLDELSKLNRLDINVAIEPGCHSPSRFRQMKAVIEALGAHYIGNRYGCCGKSVPGVTELLMKEREAEIAGADAVIVVCPSCFGKYDSAEDGVPVMHIAELVAVAAGKKESLTHHRIKVDL